MAHNNTTGLCTDRFGMVDPQTFTYRSCGMCYMYLFRTPQSLGYHSDMMRLMPTDDSDMGVQPDPDNKNAIDYVCNTLDAVGCKQWRSCCEDAVTCCETQLTSSSAVTPEGYCSRTWDGYSCWGDAKAGTDIAQSCPDFLAYAASSNNAIKSCLDNATWFTQDGMQEWTDYTPCIDRERHKIGVYVTVALSIASIALLFPAIFILSSFSNLRKQHRIRLHIHFFFALMLCSLSYILWYMLVHYNLVNEGVNKVLYSNPIWCRVLSYFKIYLTSATYMWMFCEGYYLHRLISRAFEPPKSLLPLYILGWGLPLIPVTVYAVIRGCLDNESCWAFNFGPAQWIIYAPNLLCLLTNLVFLCNILRILLFELHSHPHEPNSFRRGLKAVFMLIPLFGLQLFLTIYRPPVGTAGEQGYEIFQFVVGSSQGIFVSLIFCFFNGEVIAQLSKFCGCCTCCPFARSKCQRRFSVQMTQVTSAEDFRTPNPSIKSPSLSNGSSPAKKISAGSLNNGGGELELMDGSEDRLSFDISRDASCDMSRDASPSPCEDIRIVVPQQKLNNTNGTNGKKVKYAKLTTVVDI